MIKANELRIGNLVHNALNAVVKVEAIGYNIINPGAEFSPEMKYLKGIPLTPEILEKAGFTYRYLSPKQHYFENGMVSINTYKTKDSFYYESQLCDVSIDYVHQLQNLYYALCGSELTINI